MKLVSVSEMRAIEQEANSKGVSYEQMMERAGFGLAHVILSQFSEVEDRNVMGLVGSGNNGGDTLVALALLADKGWKARAYLSRPRSAKDRLVKRLLKAGGEVLNAKQDPQMENLDEWLKSSVILLDGVLGTGIKLPLKPELAALLDHVTNYSNLPHVVAVDCPSGVDCDLGNVANECIPAEITVCMQAVKTGMLRFPAYELVGQLSVVDIGLPAGLQSWSGIKRQVVTPDFVQDIIPERRSDAHKGTFGTAMIVAGSINYTGAAFLAAKAAYRIGSGLVQLAVPGPLHAALAGHLPEVIWLVLPHDIGVIEESAYRVVVKNLSKITSLLIGPGLGLEDTTAEFVRRLIGGKVADRPRTGIGFVAQKVEKKKIELPPLVVDADGLKLLAQIPEWYQSLPSLTILTPHPGEMAVLTGRSVTEIQDNRIAIAELFAKKWGHVIVLKGALTVISSPDGRLGVIPVATAALARAGTGDVLAGIIVGLRAQGIPAFEAAIAGAWIHAQAGMIAADVIGHSAAVLAGDVLDAIPEVLWEL